jgi:hypothetical protein
MEEISSTISATRGRRVFHWMPVVLGLLMRIKFFRKGQAAAYQQKGQPAHAAALLAWFAV